MTVTVQEGVATFSVTLNDIMAYIEICPRKDREQIEEKLFPVTKKESLYDVAMGEYLEQVRGKYSLEEIKKVLPI